jgi:hypothetical protein
MRVYASWTAAEADAMRRLLEDLRRRKGRGWSVVLGHDELVIRAPARELGKFSVTVWRGELRIGFHDRGLNHWADWHRLPAGPDVASAVLAWVEAVAAGRSR